MAQYVKAGNPNDTIVVGLAGTDGNTVDAFTVDIAAVEAIGNGTDAATAATATITITSTAGDAVTLAGALSGSTGAATITYL